jgi:heme/copper-type cytochrome/quinol oxidase subunit 4
LLDQSHGKPWSVAVYLIVMAVITLISVWLAEETNKKAL